MINPNATLEEMLRKLKSVKEHSYVELTKLNWKTYSVRIIKGVEFHLLRNFPMSIVGERQRLEKVIEGVCAVVENCMHQKLVGIDTQDTFIRHEVRNENIQKICAEVRRLCDRHQRSYETYWIGFWIDWKNPSKWLDIAIHLIKMIVKTSRCWLQRGFSGNWEKAHQEVENAYHKLKELEKQVKKHCDGDCQFYRSFNGYDQEVEISKKLEKSVVCFKEIEKISQRPSFYTKRALEAAKIKRYYFSTHRISERKKNCQKALQSFIYSPQQKNFEEFYILTKPFIDAGSFFADYIKKIAGDAGVDIPLSKDEMSKIKNYQEEYEKAILALDEGGKIEMQDFLNQTKAFIERKQLGFALITAHWIYDKSGMEKCVSYFNKNKEYLAYDNRKPLEIPKSTLEIEKILFEVDVYEKNLELFIQDPSSEENLKNLLKHREEFIQKEYHLKFLEAVDNEKMMKPQWDEFEEKIPGIKTNIGFFLDNPSENNLGYFTDAKKIFRGALPLLKTLTQKLGFEDFYVVEGQHYFSELENFMKDLDHCAQYKSNESSLEMFVDEAVVHAFNLIQNDKNVDGCAFWRFISFLAKQKGLALPSYEKIAGLLRKIDRRF